MFIQIHDDVDGTIHTFPFDTIRMDELTSDHWEEPGTYFVNGTKVDYSVYVKIMKMVESRGLTKAW